MDKRPIDTARSASHELARWKNRAGIRSCRGFAGMYLFAQRPMLKDVYKRKLTPSDRCSKQVSL